MKLVVVIDAYNHEAGSLERDRADWFPTDDPQLISVDKSYLRIDEKDDCYYLFPLIAVLPADGDSSEASGLFEYAFRWPNGVRRLVSSWEELERRITNANETSAEVPRGIPEMRTRWGPLGGHRPPALNEDEELRSWWWIFDADSGKALTRVTATNGFDALCAYSEAEGFVPYKRPGEEDPDGIAAFLHEGRWHGPFTNLNIYADRDEERDVVQ